MRVAARVPMQILCVVLASLYLYGLLVHPDFASAAGPSTNAPLQTNQTHTEGTKAPPSEYLRTKTCNPCRFTIGTNLPPYSVYFPPREGPGEKAPFDTLQIARDDRPDRAQSVRTDTPFERGDEFLIGTEDINFDGYNDLVLLTRSGAANTYSDYWLFDPATEAFRYLGNYPSFKVNPVSRTLSTYERDGASHYETGTYRFVKGVLTLVEVVKEDYTDKLTRIRRLYRLKDGKLRLIKKETVREPQRK